MTVQDYPSRLSDPASRRLGTFSYLPEMTADQVRRQVQWIVRNGWNPAIEHTEAQFARSTYWYMWKLPMFGETDIDAIMAELAACHAANPGHHVRLLGYDNFAQSQGASMVVYRASPV
ncbi:MAG: ribulose bisphosphate carboxylase small subunit [Alphaproteobacteria bacterium]|nr:MAG: ribulose bisphosphate carboxylase small subunit [Alphaproteobacteria bacterium]